MKAQDILRMTEQMAGFFSSYGKDEARKEIANHINSFWDPRMRQALFAYAATPDARLNPLVSEALPLIRRPVA